MYAFELEPTVDDRLAFAEERILRWRPEIPTDFRSSLGSGHSESRLKKEQAKKRNRSTARSVYEAISSWTVYHFHDTSESAAIRRAGSVRDNERLRPDGANLAAFLLRLKDERLPAYDLIGDTMRLAAPFFEDFRFRPQKSKGNELVALEWKQRHSDYPFHCPAVRLWHTAFAAERRTGKYVCRARKIGIRGIPSERPSEAPDSQGVGE